jgi:hypothetical protein
MLGPDAHLAALGFNLFCNLTALGADRRAMKFARARYQAGKAAGAQDFNVASHGVFRLQFRPSACARRERSGITAAVGKAKRIHQVAGLGETHLQLESHALPSAFQFSDPDGARFRGTVLVSGMFHKLVLLLTSTKAADHYGKNRETALRPYSGKFQRVGQNPV